MNMDFEPNFQEQNQPHRRRVKRTKIRSGVGMGVTITLAAVAAVIFGITVFFRVNTIVVRGNSVYDSAAVIGASGISKGDNLLTVNKSAVAAGIEVALPYVEHVRIARVMPDTVILEITESQAVFSVRAEDGSYWLMNFYGKLLEQVDAETAAKKAVVEGFTVKDPAVGEKAQSATPDNLEAMKQLLLALDGTGLVDKLTAVNASKTYDLTVRYTDQFEIRFGSTQDLAYKVRYLMAVMPELLDYQSGIIDVTFEEEKVARFMPW